MNDYPPLDVIAVGAHPDDVEIACGGTLASLVRQGYRVGVVDLTDGEPTPGCPDPAIRRDEARQAAEKLGLRVRETLDLPNRRLFDTFEARVALAKEFRKYRPRLVIGFGGPTPTASPDHIQAKAITEAGVFYSRLTKWDEHFDHLPVHRIAKLLYFHLPFETLTGSLGPHFVVDIGETLEAKIEAVRCYQTQFPPNREEIFDRIRAMAAAAGVPCGFTAGEVFLGSRTLGVRDPMQLLFSV